MYLHARLNRFFLLCQIRVISGLSDFGTLLSNLKGGNDGFFKPFEFAYMFI